MTVPLHAIEGLDDHDILDSIHDVGEPSAIGSEAWTETQIDQVLARLRALRADAAEVTDIAYERMQQIENWQHERLAVIQAAIDHRLAFLQAWHEHLLHQDPKRKTVSLPSGTLKSRAHAEKIDVTDEPEFVGWAQEHAPDLVREKVTHAPAKGEFPGPLRVAQTTGGPVVIDSTTGEPVPGVVWKPAGRTFQADTAPIETEAS